MKRAKPGYAESISAALAVVPSRLHRYLQCDFFCGADPVFAGLHTYTVTDFGNAYSSVPHTVYVHNQAHLTASHRVTTIVLPGVYIPGWIIHELGHVLHERVGWPLTSPVTAYGHSNGYEAFAEAFTSWLVPGWGGRPDDAFLTLMDSL